MGVMYRSCSGVLDDVQKSASVAFGRDSSVSCSHRMVVGVSAGDSKDVPYEHSRLVTQIRGVYCPPRSGRVIVPLSSMGEKRTRVRFSIRRVFLISTVEGVRKRVISVVD